MMGTPTVPRRSLLSALPALTLALFLAPVAAGLIGTWLPAFGYFPALGGESFTLAPWAKLPAGARGPEVLEPPPAWMARIEEEVRRRYARWALHDGDSDRAAPQPAQRAAGTHPGAVPGAGCRRPDRHLAARLRLLPCARRRELHAGTLGKAARPARPCGVAAPHLRSEEHTSELQSLMRISYAVFCLKKKNKTTSA